MGTICFLLPESSSIRIDRLDSIYMAGIEALPFRMKVRQSETELTLERDHSESGKVFVPVQTEFGLLYLPTSTVIERDTPYRLVLELARGTLDRLRNQLDLWIRCGFKFSDELSDQVASTVHNFCQAAVLQREPTRCDNLANRTLESSVALLDRLNDEYNDQLLKVRQEQTAKLPIVIGSVLAPDYPDPLNESQLESLGVYQQRVSWKACEPDLDQFQFAALRQRIDSLRKLDKQIILGPLVQLSEDSLPDFIVQSQDFDKVRSRVVKFVRAIVSEFGDSVDMIDAFGGLNSHDSLALPADYRLRLAIDVVEAVRSVNTESPLFVTFDQPWSEGSRGENTLTPLQCADAIVRARLSVSGFILEINWAVHPAGTLPRDPIQVHTLLDLWSQFELPMFVSFCCPSNGEQDPAARRPDVFLEDPIEATEAIEAQSRAAERLLNVLMSKPFVQGLIWNQMSDTKPHRYRHAGLIDQEDKAKPVLARLAEIQRDLFMI